MAGLFFCLASAEGAGLLFCPATIQPHTSVYSTFCTAHELYRPRRKTAHGALQRLFPRFAPFYHRIYQTDTSGYNTACDTLERTTAPQPSSACQIPPPHRTLHRPAQPPYYNKVYKDAGTPPVMDPCQTVQQIADHASPAAVSMLSTPGGLRSGTGQQSERTGWHPPLAGQSSSMGAAGGAEPLAACAASLFGLSPDSQ